MQRIERAMPGPDPQHCLALRRARQQTVTRLRHEEIDEAVLEPVRTVHRRDGADWARRSALADRSEAFAASFAEPATSEGRATEPFQLGTSRRKEAAADLGKSVRHVTRLVAALKRLTEAVDAGAGTLGGDRGLSEAASHAVEAARTRRTC